MSSCLSFPKTLGVYLICDYEYIISIGKSKVGYYIMYTPSNSMYCNYLSSDGSWYSCMGSIYGTYFDTEEDAISILNTSHKYISSSFINDFDLGVH